MTIQPNLYGVVTTKRPREVVLLNTVGGCSWHRCAFCEYCDTYSRTAHEAEMFNMVPLSQVTGAYSNLQVICSASFIELPIATWYALKRVIQEKRITNLIIESHWMHRAHDAEIRSFFSGTLVDIIYGIDSFNLLRREVEWFKGYGNITPEELSQYASSVNLLIGVQGQTLNEIIDEIETAVRLFKWVNVIAFEENDTPFRRDNDLLNEFYQSDIFKKYREDPRVDIMDGCDSRAPDNLGNVGTGCRY